MIKKKGLCQQFRENIRIIQSMLIKLKPFMITKPPSRNICIISDAAGANARCPPTLCGAIMENGVVAASFTVEISSPLPGGHDIVALELYAFLFSILFFRLDRPGDVSLQGLIDNQAGLFSVIKGYCRSPHARQLTRALSFIYGAHHSRLSYIPSGLNPTDVGTRRRYKRRDSFRHPLEQQVADKLQFVSFEHFHLIIKRCLRGIPKNVNLSDTDWIQEREIFISQHKKAI